MQNDFFEFPEMLPRIMRGLRWAAWAASLYVAFAIGAYCAVMGWL